MNFGSTFQSDKAPTALNQRDKYTPVMLKKEWSFSTFFIVYIQYVFITSKLLNYH